MNIKRIYNGSACSIAMAASFASAQPCQRDWIAVGGLDGDVLALTMWDPDGAGPAPAMLVVGGRFTTAGGQAASNIAAWDPVTGAWSPLGAGVNGRIHALASLPNGDLIAGGLFTEAGSVEDANHVARWDGSRWHSMDGGMRGTWQHPLPRVGIYALAVLSGGEIVAGGQFDTAGDAEARNIALWDGAAWRALGDQLDGTVEALFPLPGRDVVAGGRFEFAGSIARWDGLGWHSLAGGVRGGFPETALGVWSLAPRSGGGLIAGGPFTSAGGEPAHGIAQWDGAAWAPLGAGLRGMFFAIAWELATLPGGDVIAGGEFNRAGDTEASNIARWDGERWHSLGSGVSGMVNALAILPSGDLAVGGGFLRAGGLDSPNLAIWGRRDCYADCDNDGELTFFDFLCFQNLFVTGDPFADCDESGQLDFFDFLCFQNAFAAGCA